MLKTAASQETKSAPQPPLMDHNLFISWKPDFNIGIPIIDEHHRGIVSIINALYYGMQHKYVRDVISPINDMMYDYTRIHFQIEETFLAMFDEKKANRHRELHQELSTKLNWMGRSSLLDKDPYPFMDFLKQWWINHICHEDLIFRDNMIKWK